jgi:hypothetical protein
LEISSIVKMETESVTSTSVFEMAQTLNTEEKWTLLENLLSLLKGVEAPKKTKGKRTKKDPSAPKKEMSPYMELATKIVLPVLKELSESETDPEEKKRLRGVGARTKVASKLWKGMTSKDDLKSVTREQILEAYEEWKATPEGVQSDEEKPKKASKAKKGAEKPAAISIPPNDEDEELELTPEEWEHDFGKGKKTYERIEYDGKKYIYDIETKEYMGVYDEKKKKLDKSVKDILLGQ